MKQGSLLQLLLILCLGFLTSTGNAQTQKYHRIEVRVSNAQFRDLMRAGMEIDHYEYRDGVLSAEVSDADYYDNLLSSQRSILIGDFNSNTIWDYKKHRLSDHSSVVKFLEERGILVPITCTINRSKERRSIPPFTCTGTKTNLIISTIVLFRQT